MALSTQIPQREPQFIAAGDTLEWERQFADFNANDWTLHYILRNQGDIYKFDATNSAGLFLVQVASSVTAAWKPGKYLIGAWMTNASNEQKQVRPSFPNMVIGPNLASNPNGAPTETFAAKSLAAIQNTILALTARTVETASINGSAYTLANISDLFTLRERFRSEVAREEQQDRLNAGLGAGNKVAVRFRPINQVGYTNWNWQVPWQ